MAIMGVTKSEIRLIRGLRRLRSRSTVAQTEDTGENVATYSLSGKTPTAFMRDNFGKPSMPEDEPDGTPAEQIMIEFEE